MPPPSSARHDDPSRSTGVLLVDDHRAFTDALRMSLETQADLRCVATAHTADEALACAASVDFAVAIVDLDLPDAGGLDVVARLRELRPDARVVVLTAHARPDLAERAVAIGVTAFLGKDETLDRIVRAVRWTEERPLVGPSLRRTAADGLDLTHREYDVLRRLGLGRDAQAIAGELGITLHTTRGHIKSVIAKLGAHSQLEAVVAAGRLGLITVGSRF